jgi:hypothetical protein
MHKSVIAAAVFAAVVAGCARQPEPEPASRPTLKPQADPAPASTDGPALAHVVFDQSLGQISSPHDTSFEGLSRLTSLLRGHRATVSVNNAPLSTFLAQRGHGDVLVLGIAWGQAHSAAGLEALDAFMRRGGGVLVLSEHDDMYGSTANHDAFTARHGIRTLPRVAEGTAVDPLQRRWPQVALPELGVARARFFWPAPLSVSAPARALAELVAPADASARVVGARAQVGRGQLVVLGDLELFWNMAGELGLRAADNAELALRLFGELAGHGAALSRGGVEPRLPAANAAGTRCARFERSGQALYPDGSPIGLRALAEHLASWGFRVEAADSSAQPLHCELAIVVTPLEAPARAVAEAARLLVVGDGRSDFLRAEPALSGALGLGSEPAQTDPWEALLSPLGLRFARVTLLDAQDGLTPEARLGPEAIRLHRSAVVEHAQGRVLIEAPEARPTHNLTPAHESVGGSPVDLTQRPRRPDAPAGPPGSSVAVRTQRVLALADLELVTDQTSSPAVIAELADWLGVDRASR